MTEENKAKLMQAYRAAVAAGQDGIADMLEDVILGEMGQEKTVTWRDVPNIDMGPLYNALSSSPTCSGERAIGRESRAKDAR